MLERDIEDALKEMPSGTHTIMFYDTPENKREVLFSHLKQGVHKEGLVYVCSEETPEAISSEMVRFGVDVKDRLGELNIRKYDEVYIVDGNVDPAKIVNDFASAASDYIGRGRVGIRAGAEMSCFFRQDKIDELIQYEKALHQTFAFPGKGICAYNLLEMRDAGNVGLLWPLIKAHGLVIMTGPTGGFALEEKRVTEKDVKATTAAVLG